LTTKTVSGHGTANGQRVFQMVGAATPKLRCVDAGCKQQIGVDLQLEPMTSWSNVRRSNN